MSWSCRRTRTATGGTGRGSRRARRWSSGRCAPGGPAPTSHSGARTAAETDWREIAALYGELIRYEPTPVVEANRAVTVAMSEGPAAGLVILDAVGTHPQLARWPQLHIARADLLRRLGRHEDAVAAYRTALELEPAAPERGFIQRRIQQLG